MDISYLEEGYTLMIGYMRQNKILTKERNFRRRLDTFYNKHKDDNELGVNEELEYLKLERYFYNNIIAPSNNEEKALTNFLNILTSIDKIEEE